MYSKLLSKLNKLESEANELKLSLVKSKALGEKVSLKGFFKGVKITDSDIETAKLAFCSF